MKTDLICLDDEVVLPAIEAPGRPPDVSLVRGIRGKEPELCLLGSSATLLARRAMSLARFSEDRKI
jgi:predicted fused transcriptional regulator/phosphomethylpyrimidine kinase